MKIALAPFALALAACGQTALPTSTAQLATQAVDQPEAAVPEVPDNSDAAPDAGTPADADAIEDASAPATDNYLTMCAHYCNALGETNLYWCLANGGSVGDCTYQVAALPESCYELRCVPRRVSPELCLTQCDSLAHVYEPACAPPLPAPLCPQPAPEHDQLCRAGCTVR